MSKPRNRAVLYLVLFLLSLFGVMVVTWVIEPQAVATPRDFLKALGNAFIGVATVFAFLIAALELFVFPSQAKPQATILERVTLDDLYKKLGDECRGAGGTQAAKEVVVQE